MDIHALISNSLPTSQNTTFARTFISTYSFCFFFDFVRCIKVSFPVTNTTGICKFVWKTHSNLVILGHLQNQLSADGILDINLEPEVSLSVF